MFNDVEKILFSQEKILERTKVLGTQISQDYMGKKLILISILKGSAIFMADLLKNITIPCQIDFMAVSSYCGGTKSTGEVKIIKDLDMSLEGFDVLLVEDILDTGRTLNYIKNLLKNRNPSSINICTMLDKPSKRVVDIDAKYVGFKIPDEFVVGYGLDFKEEYRNLPFVGILKPSVYSA